MIVNYYCHHYRVKEIAKQERSSQKFFASLSQDDDSDEELTAEQKREH